MGSNYDSDQDIDGLLGYDEIDNIFQTEPRVVLANQSVSGRRAGIVAKCLVQAGGRCRSLILSGNMLSDADFFTIFCQPPKQKPRIKNEDKESGSLANAYVLEYIDLSGNILTSKCAPAISDLIMAVDGCARFKRLRSLVLDENKLTATGAEMVAKSLVKSAMRYFSACNNNFGVFGEEFYFTVKLNRTLHTLKLNYCALNDDVAVAFAEALEFNRTLRELHVAYNEFSNIGILAFETAFRGISKRGAVALEYLNLSDTKRVDDTCLVAFMNLFQSEANSRCFINFRGCAVIEISLTKFEEFMQQEGFLMEKIRIQPMGRASSKSSGQMQPKTYDDFLNERDNELDHQRLESDAMFLKHKAEGKRLSKERAQNKSSPSKTKQKNTIRSSNRRGNVDMSNRNDPLRNLTLEQLPDSDIDVDQYLLDYDHDSDAGHSFEFPSIDAPVPLIPSARSARSRSNPNASKRDKANKKEAYSVNPSSDFSEEH